MKGLELEHKNNIISAFTENNVVAITINMSKKSIDVEMNGVEGGNFVKWYYSSLSIGESVRVKVKDVNQNSGFQMIKNRNDLLKEEFDLLEKELKEKGLL
jgi:hypothetical protein